MSKIPKSVTEAHRLMLSKQLTPTKLIENIYERIQETSHLNAYIQVRDISLAKAEAKKADLRYKIGKPLSPIDGIPISIKDNILVKGMNATGGSQILNDFIAPVDATLVEKI
jgi:aspartyl-tRNA(Asn)/glutamyl-tRNA(Gln) amidotransferase subunit A